MSLEYSARPNKFSGKNKVGVAYARFSSDNQREESIEAQVRAIKYYAQNFGIDIERVYIDRARSGRTDDRPQFKQMIEDSKHGEFGIVLVHKLDRFSRDAADTNYYEKVLNENGVQLISVLEKLDESPEGQLMKQIIIGMNAFYSANLAREVRKGLKETALQGKFTGGPVLFGYDIVDGEYVINEKNAELVRRIFNMYASGISTRQIAKALNEEGYRSQRNSYYSPRTIGDMLNNEKYIGIYQYNLNGEVITVEDAIPPIISYDLWLDVREEAKKIGKRKSNGKQTYYLTGKMVCGECGARFSGGRSTKNRWGSVYHYYNCNNSYKSMCNNKSVNKHFIESYLLDEIGARILEDDVIDEIASKAVIHANNEINNPTTSSKELEKKIKDITKKIEKLMDLYMDDMIDKNTLNNKAEKMKHDLNLLEREKRKAIQLESATTLSKNDFKEYLKSWRIDTEDKDMARSLIDTFVDKVIVFHDRIDVNLKIDFSVIGGKSISDGVSSNEKRAGAYRSVPLMLHTFSITKKEFKKVCSKYNHTLLRDK